MKKYIITTTINNPTQALLKYITFSDWTIVVVGDLKTPHEEYLKLQKENKNFIYLSPDKQNELYPEISSKIPFNCIQRRTIGYMHAYFEGADILASVDDDNIPFNNWGSNIIIGKPTEVYYYETDELAFDPIGSATNHTNLWHRGFPLQFLKNKNNFRIKRKVITPDVQACFWNGDPDIDAVCRFEHYPNCFFSSNYFPISSNAFTPFNQQNTFLSRNVIPFYCAQPFVGRMDDIWPSYYVQAKGFSVVFTEPTVFQDRNVQNLTKNLSDECMGYLNTHLLLEDIKKDPANYDKYLNENALSFWSGYKDFMNKGK